MIHFKKTVILFSLVVLSATGTATAANNCLNFFQELRPQQPFNGGTFAINSNASVSITLGPLWLNPNQYTFGLSEYEEMDECFGGPGALEVNNVSLQMSFQFDPNDYSSININYCDFGGIGNVSARFINPADFIDEIEDVAGIDLPDPNGNDTAMDVRWQQIPGGTEGKLIYKGEDLSQLVLGGQELFVHSICLNQ